MPDLLPHRRLQAAAAAGFGEEAKAIGRRVLTTDTLLAAQVLVTNVLTNESSGGPISEAAGDVRVLRMANSFNAPLERDLTMSNVSLVALMLAAMEHGYSSEARGQAAQIKGLTGLVVTDQDRLDMAGYPIQGHTCYEISRYMHDSFRYEITGLLASPLVGDANASMLPALIADSVRRFADKCGAAVGEAYYAGAQMAIRAIAAALRAV